MDGSHFDAWTRRRFGVAAGGLAGSLLAQAGTPGAEAKKGKKKKKKCGKLNASCNQNKKTCCCGYECFEPNGGGARCCRTVGFPAASAGDCCSARIELGTCICKTVGQPCSSSQNCCSGFCNATTDQCGTPP
jgi:hypothetical protein